ncbi:MAG: S1C family serine protease [Planctomycetota bacterium]|jgi:serine protease Do
MTTFLRPSVLPLLLFPLLATAQEPAPKPDGKLVARGPLQAVEADAGDRELRTTPVVRAVQRAADSVVSIYLQNQLARGNAVTEGQGSGVLLDEQGLVITNWHVVAPVLEGRRGNPLDVVVKLRDGRTRPGKVLSSSAKRDLALLQLRLEGDEKVKPIEVGRSSDLMIGETVIAIGNPQGHANTVTSGVLSAIDRSIQVRTPDGEVREYAGLLQTDAAINQGNSGGALLDITGRLIGINNAMAMGAENIGFAIPIDTVRTEFENELFRSDSFANGPGSAWLGIEVAERDGAVAVASVVPGGPAARAGLRVGDLLYKLAGQEVRTPIDYLRRLASAVPNRPLPMLLRRGSADVAVETEPWTREQGIVLRGLGMVVDEVDDKDVVEKVTLAFYRGSGLSRVPLFPSALRLYRVDDGGPTDGILRPGDLILGAMVRTPFGEREAKIHALRDLANLVEQARGRVIRLAILRGDDDMIATLDVRDDDKR